MERDPVIDTLEALCVLGVLYAIFLGAVFWFWWGTRNKGRK